MQRIAMALLVASVAYYLISGEPRRTEFLNGFFYWVGFVLERVSSVVHSAVDAAFSDTR